MNFSSRVNVLLVENTVSKSINPKTGKAYESCEARCVLLGDGDDVVSVGRLRVPVHLQPVIHRGIFRASFALVVRDWGDKKGDIVADLVGLVEEPPARVVGSSSAGVTAKA